MLKPYGYPLTHGQRNQPPSGGCVLKPGEDNYARAMVLTQPPSGGCVLKPLRERKTHLEPLQPPSGGCVLKPEKAINLELKPFQPPSGGCVLKPEQPKPHLSEDDPAAFGRLCVETVDFGILGRYLTQPPSGGCVLKPFSPTRIFLSFSQPPSGGCVLKRQLYGYHLQSPFPAAFGRLCVEHS
ncbi:hypothetical protein NEISICOT_02635 [Neisseria sicca ATCC 29256]|uniref:Uncharacterized protein n=1 Tax=Neisseria sicca ATCC 29256 TaxID=547045 RepID=C6M7X0_NEISI|nr:hypothetical protein NEISICOT_02635 [Neisseria sicca ATCC 29256]